jgi:cation diffusion facilitator CzcD-associated flavoprotein CzcO
MTSVAVVGGGFAGITAGVMLAKEGYEDVTIFERGDRVGGVWNWNTYPGIACDVPSHLYEFSFAPNPDWSRRYSPGSEIQAYIEKVARDHGVLDKVRLSTEVQSATFDEETGRWTLQTSAGPFEADVVITGCGQLSVPSIPPLPGLDEFEGPAFHTARWQHEVDVTGKRVAVIGTGCSAIQTVPSIQSQVAHVDVYQRSPGWTFPKMDYAYSERAKRLFRRFPILMRIDRVVTLAFMDLITAGLTSRRWIVKPFEAIARRQITKAISDPELRAKVTPSDDLGCKRIMITDEWYPTLCKPNVELITDRVAAITPKGVRTEDGAERPADVLVLATGFRTQDFVAPMQITGREGVTLEEAWADVPKAYLGITVPGFPNMFLLYGPNTNGGAGSVIYTHECAMAHIIDAIRTRERAAARTIEVRPDAAEAFDRELREALVGTVWQTGCDSWYVDDAGNNPNNWPWLWATYKRRTSRIDPAAYQLA